MAFDFLKSLWRPAPRTVVKKVAVIPNSPVPQLAASGEYFEALRSSPDRIPMTPASLSPAGVAVMAYGARARLSAVTRALYDNGGYVGYAVNQIAFYSTPLYPQAASKDLGWNTEAEAYFADWSQRCDFLGRPEMDFYGLQQVASQGLDLDGDAGAVMTAEAGFPQIQLIEGWQIGARQSIADKSLFDGVRLDAKGRVIGYEIDGGTKAIPVPAGMMMLIREPSIGSPYRGLSPMRRGMNDIRDARDIQHFEKVAVKQLASMVGAIEGGYLDEDHGFSLGDETPPEVPVSPQPDGAESPAKGLSRADMMGGDIPVIPEGKKWVDVTPNRPNGTFGEFQDTLVSWYVAGLDIPPAFFLDAKLTGPNQRAVNAKAQRKFDHRKLAIARFVQWVWVRVIGWGISRGDLRSVDGWQRITLQGPASFTIDAGREAQQDREDHSRGLKTRRDSFGGRGLDWVRETDQIEAEWEYCIKKAKRLSEMSGLPLSTTLTFFGGGINPVGQANAQAAAQQEAAKDAQDPSKEDGGT